MEIHTVTFTTAKGTTVTWRFKDKDDALQVLGALSLEFQCEYRVEIEGVY